jgi:hypothetical protein
MQPGQSGFAASPLVPVQIPLTDFPASGRLVTAGTLTEAIAAYYHSTPEDNDGASIVTVEARLVLYPGTGAVKTAPMQFEINTFATETAVFNEQGTVVEGSFGCKINDFQAATTILLQEKTELPILPPDLDIEFLVTYVFFSGDLNLVPGLYVSILPGASWRGITGACQRQVEIVGPLTLPSQGISTVVFTGSNILAHPNVQSRIPKRTPSRNANRLSKLLNKN